MFNGNSTFANGNPFAAAADDRMVRSLPWPFRVAIPGFVGGWPA